MGITYLVNTLYSATNEQSRQQAAKWLESFERTEEAWSIAMSTLSSSSSSSSHSISDITPTIRLFSAQVIRHKVVKDLFKLSEQHITHLRTSILDLLSNTTNTSTLTPPIITQLCLSLAEMSIHVPSWINPVAEVTTRFGNRQELAFAFLEFLTVLPQELLKEKDSLTRDEYADRSSALLDSNAVSVFQSLVHFLQSDSARSDPNLQSKLYACLDAWFDTHSIPLVSIAESPIIPIAFQGLSSDDLFQSSASILASLLDHAEPDITHGTLQGTKILESALPLVLQHCPVLIRDASDDEDKAKALVKVITSTCMACLNPILENPGQYTALLDLILTAMLLPYLDVLNQAFDFWAQLTASVLQDDQTPPNRDTHLLYPAFHRLVRILVQQMRFPPDGQDDSWSAKDRDEFREFRHSMGDVLRDCFEVLGHESVMGDLTQLVTQFLQTSPQEQVNKWAEVEAILCAMRSIANQAITSQSPHVPTIIQALPNLFNLHPKLRPSVLVVVGCYSPWVKANIQYLPNLMDLVSQGFNTGDTECSWAAPRTLRFLAHDMPQQMHAYLELLYPFYLNQLDFMTPSEAVDVVEAIALIIKHAPYDQIAPLLQKFAEPLVSKLNVAQSVPEIKAALNRLATIVRTVQPRVDLAHMHPTHGLVDALWPYFIQLLTVHSREDPITEGIAKIIRNTLLPDMMPHYTTDKVQRIVDLVMAQFAQTQFSCWQWVSTHVIDYFGAHPQWIPSMLLLLESLAQSTATMAQAHGFDEAFEQVDELHGLLAAVLNTIPQHYLTWSPTIDNLHQFTVLALQHSTHPRTISSIVYYLRYLIDVFTPVHHHHYLGFGINTLDLCPKLVEPVAQQILHLLMVKYVSGCIDLGDTFHDTLHVFGTLATLFPTLFSDWIRQGLQGMLFLNPVERDTILYLFNSLIPQQEQQQQQQILQVSVHRAREALIKLAQLHLRRVGDGADQVRHRQRRH